MLHLNGANLSTTIVDSNAGGSPHTWTCAGAAAISTTQSEFGGASGTFDGSGSWISTPDSTDFTLGSGDFTIDTWFYWSGGSGVRGFLAGQDDPTGSSLLSAWNLEHRATNVMRSVVSDNTGAVFVIDGTTAITTTGWHHLALVRTGNVLKLFLDGTQEGGDVAMTTPVRDSSNNVAIGTAGEITTSTWNGFIDEFRLSVGIARWTANFTPPTLQYATAISSVISGSGNIVANFNLSQIGSAVLSGVGNLVVNGQVYLTSSATLAGVSSLVAGSNLYRPSSAVLSGIGNVVASSTLYRVGVAVLAGAANLVVNSNLYRTAIAKLSGVGSIAATTSIALTANAVLSGAANLTSIGIFYFTDSAVLSGSSQFIANASDFKPGGEVLSGAANLLVHGEVYFVASSILNGAGNLIVNSYLSRPPVIGGGYAGYIPYPDRKESKRSETRIVNVSYNSGSKQLIVTTNIVFNGVPPRLFKEMKESKDKARYFKAHIKGRYQEDPID